MNRSSQRTGERGSLALEQVLFIGAVVLMATGVVAFYSNLGNYLGGVNIPESPQIPNTAVGPINTGK